MAKCCKILTCHCFSCSTTKANWSLHHFYREHGFRSSFRAASPSTSFAATAPAMRCPAAARIMFSATWSFSKATAATSTPKPAHRCLTLSLDENRDTLLANNAFLQLIGASLAKKMALITELDAAPSSLSDRVLSYMRYRCPDGILKGVEKTAFHFHCSPREPQRILNRFTQEGQVEKIGKGTYRLL